MTWHAGVVRNSQSRAIFNPPENCARKNQPPLNIALRKNQPPYAIFNPGSLVRPCCPQSTLGKITIRMRTFSSHSTW